MALVDVVVEVVVVAVVRVAALPVVALKVVIGMAVGEGVVVEGDGGGGRDRGCRRGKILALDMLEIMAALYLALEGRRRACSSGWVWFEGVGAGAGELLGEKRRTM